MTHLTPESIISGIPYRVLEVAGRTPTAFADFAAAAEFTIDQDGQAHRVEGHGVDQGTAVRFHEKHPGPDGKDVRVWQISQTGDGGFIAEHAAAF